MLIRRIHGKTLAEAVEKTRAECGEEALLVDSRKTRDGYLIVAARPPRPEARSTASAHPTRWTRGFEPLARRATEFGLSSSILSAVEKTLRGTRVELGQPGDPALPSAAARVFRSLIRTTRLELPRSKVTALVGCTGVGKTTTLAKLAATAARGADESVAIITIDTYRIAAVEQLRAFADMLAVPFEVAFTPADLRRAVAAHAGADRIFIDTSGRSPFDRKAIGALQSTLEPSQPSCTLCVSAHARRIDVMATLSAFAPLEIGSVVLTKWDETVAPGEALSVLVEQGLPISHVTVGQEVPEDIADAHPGALAAAAFARREDVAEAIL